MKFTPNFIAFVVGFGLRGFYTEIACANDLSQDYVHSYEVYTRKLGEEL